MLCNRLLCKLNVASAAFVVAEDRSDLSLRYLEQASARCTAYIPEASSYRVLVKGTGVAHTSAHVLRRIRNQRGRALEGLLKRYFKA